MMTAAVSALPDDVRARAIELTRTFDDFTPDYDPHNEHDFGSFEIDDQKFIFKHDYYDKSMQYGSKDPGDPQKTTRVLTIMLADDLPLGIWPSNCQDKSPKLEPPSSTKLTMFRPAEFSITPDGAPRQGTRRTNPPPFSDDAPLGH